MGSVTQRITSYLRAARGNRSGIYQGVQTKKVTFNNLPVGALAAGANQNFNLAVDSSTDAFTTEAADSVIVNISAAGIQLAANAFCTPGHVDFTLTNISGAPWAGGNVTFSVTILKNL